MQFQAAAHGAGGRVLNGDLLRLFGDLIDAVAYVRDVELQVKIAGLGTPEIDSGSEVGGEMLWQPWTIFDDGAAAIAHRAASPEAAPPIAIENLRGTSMRLIEGGGDALAGNKRFVASEPAGDGAFEIDPCRSVL